MSKSRQLFLTKLLLSAKMGLIVMWRLHGVASKAGCSYKNGVLCYFGAVEDVSKNQLDC